MSLALGSQLPAERLLVEVVDEGSFAVDLDDREPFSVGLLERSDAGDVDLLVREVDLGPQPLKLGAGPVPERTPLAVEEDNVRGATWRSRTRGWCVRHGEHPRDVSLY